MSLQYFDLNSVTIETRFAPWTHGHDIDAITGLRAELDAAQSGLTSTSDILFHDAVIYGDMVPNTSGGQSLGSTTKHFGTAWIDELHLAQNTLYLGDTPVIGTNQDTVEIKADTDQNITLKTLGTGESKITSQNGVEISNSGLNGQIAIQSTGSGGMVSFGATSSINFTAPDANFSGDIEVTGHTVFNTATFTNDVVFQGDNIQMDTTNFTAEDNRITLNSGEQGNGVTAGFAGFDIDRGTLASWQFVFNEATDTFEYGPVGGTANVVVSKAYVDGVDALKLNAALYTAADVFSKVKSLDGSGSGLDADLLDGHEATYFVKSASDYMDAIQSIDGSGSGLDADLLDGEEGAYYAPQGSTYTKTEVDNIAAIKLDSSLYTNASVLSKLSNVDGAGSGLDADLLDGHEGTYFATASHTHSSTYLGLTAKAADANKLDGHDSTYFASQDSTYTNTEVDTIADTKLDSSSYTAADVFSKVKSLDGAGSGLDADLLDGHSSTYFAPQSSTFTKTEVNNIAANKLDSSAYTAADVLAKIKTVDGNGSGLDADTLDGHNSNYFSASTHNHNANYLGITAKASDADKLDGHDSSYFAVAGSTDTSSEVDAKIAALVDSSPAALDTLNELAAALGDDPNFATTVNNNIAAKLDSSAYTAADVLAKIKTVDGSGSGLDADLFDGHSSGSFLRSDAIDTATSKIVFNGGLNTVGLQIKRTTSASTGDDIVNLSVDDSGLIFSIDNDNDGDSGSYRFNYRTAGADSALLAFSPTAITYKGNKVWHAGNDGSGSGLNADMLDSHSASYFLAASAYTAADVLAKIKTVDGSGSGLDADTLDSHSASYFLSTTGKAADSNLLDGVDGTYYRGRNYGATSQDPDLATYPNILSNHANSPNAASYWHITTTFYSTISSTANRGQIAVQYNGGANFAVYARSCYSTTWTPWTRCDNNGTAADSTLFGGHPVSYFSASTHNHSTTYLGITAKAADSDKLDGLNSTQFLRSDANDDMSGKLTIIKNVGTTPTYSGGQLELKNTDGGDVSMGFHRSGFTACQLRHESNGLILSGTSPTSAANLNVLGSIKQNGAQVWHTGNDGSGSGLDADLLDGHQASYFSASTHAHAALYLGLHAKADNADKLDGINSSSFLRSDISTVSSGDLTISKSNPWLTLDSPSSGGNGTDQGAGISIGEGGKKGGAALHLTYTGDGYGHIGMGAVDGTSGLPAYEAITLNYTSNTVSFLGAVSMASNCYVTGAVSSSRLYSTVATGTAPLSVASTTKVANLNADLLDGYSASHFLAATAKAADSEKVDGINGASLLRSDATDYQTNTIYTRGYLVAETAYRNRGIYGTYDNTKTQHIWSMGVGYKNAADGASFGNLYGLAYKYNGSAGGHGVYLVNNGSALCGMGTNLWTSGIVLGQATSARYADLAEKYTVEGGLTEPGQVILLGSKKADARISDAMASQQVLGVVSTNPGLMMNSELDDGHYVALKGRVPCFVFGPCAAGDPLVSYKNGMAISINHPMVASLGDLSKTPGIILGKAIESTEEKGQSTIEIVVL